MTRVTCPRCGRSLRPAADRIRPHRQPGTELLRPQGTYAEDMQ